MNNSHGHDGILIYTIFADDPLKKKKKHERSRANELQML